MKHSTEILTALIESQNKVLAVHEKIEHQKQKLQKWTRIQRDTLDAYLASVTEATESELVTLPWRAYECKDGSTSLMGLELKTSATLETVAKDLCDIARITGAVIEKTWQKVSLIVTPGTDYRYLMGFFDGSKQNYGGRT